MIYDDEFYLNTIKTSLDIRLDRDMSPSINVVHHLGSIGFSFYALKPGRVLRDSVHLAIIKGGMARTSCVLLVTGLDVWPNCEGDAEL